MKGKKCTGKYNHCEPRGYLSSGIWGCGNFDSSEPENEECVYDVEN